MIWLWVAAALVSAALAALIVERAAVKVAAAQVAGEGPALGVYRRQMAELDELADRGLLDERERRSIRAETGRRLLAAASRAEPPLKSARPRTVLAIAASIPLMAMALFLGLGAANRSGVADWRLPDQPFAARLARWRAADPATLTAPQMAAILRAIAAERPSDPEPLAHLAVAELASGAPDEAEQALQRAIAVAPRRADLWEMLGETLALRSNGDVSAEAAADFRQALALDPTAIAPRYYLARARIAAGDAAEGLADWRALLNRLPPDDTRHAELAAEIAEVAGTGSLAPPAGAGAAAVGTTQIQAMVDGLAARLNARPDDPDGWVRLVRAYAVLGETGRMDAALAQGRRRYGARADIEARLAAAARAPRLGAASAVSPPSGSP